MPERENPRSPIAQHLTRDVEHQVRPPHYRSPLSPTPSSRCSSGRLCPTLLQLRLPPTPTHMGGQARGCAGSLAMERASPRHAPRESSGYHNHCTGRAGPESLPGVRLRPPKPRGAMPKVQPAARPHADGHAPSLHRYAQFQFQFPKPGWRHALFCCSMESAVVSLEIKER
jgi:hypothetical protein